MSSMEIMESRWRTVGGLDGDLWGHREIWQLHEGSAVFSMEVWGWIEMLGWLEALGLNGALWAWMQRLCLPVEIRVAWRFRGWIQVAQFREILGDG